MTAPKHGPGSLAYRHGCTCLACAIANADIEAAGKLCDIAGTLVKACDYAFRAAAAARQGDRSRASALRAWCESEFTSAREILKPGEEV